MADTVTSLNGGHTIACCFAIQHFLDCRSAAFGPSAVVPFCFAERLPMPLSGHCRHEPAKERSGGRPDLRGCRDPLDLPLFDDLVGASQQYLRKLDAEAACGMLVQKQLELSSLEDWD